MNILVTGAAGFIGSHVVLRLCQSGYQVTGIDNLNSYYDVRLKLARLERLKQHSNFRFVQMDIVDLAGLRQLFSKGLFQHVIHLAAQAGVRYSIENPMAYADSNLTGHLSVLEACRQFHIEHLVYASSSSVYGLNSKVPFGEEDRTDQPISLYAATKKSNEMMSYSYASMYQLPSTGLRFFTVYGPWGRPDMALFKFTDAILHNKPIELYNNGQQSRDFTYIDDIVEGIFRVLNHRPVALPIPHQLFNIGNGSPVGLIEFVEALEKCIGRVAQKLYKPMQLGDVSKTWADSESLFQKLDYRPQTSVLTGVQKFVDWYRQFYGF